MMNHKKWVGLLGLTTTAVMLTCGLSGCGDDEPEQAQATPAPPPPPPPPPKPSVIPVADLMAQLGIDKRVVLEEGQAPPTTEERTAVLEFFDAFARGDVNDLHDMMSRIDAAELDELVDSGEWKATVESISRIEIQTGPSPYGDQSALALFMVDGRTQPQLWNYTVDEIEGPTFDAVATPPGIMDRLHGLDWIKVWYEIIEQELARADEVDDDLTPPPVTLEQPTSGGSSAPSAEPPPDAPARPAPGPGRRPPPSRRRPPPGPG